MIGKLGERVWVQGRRHHRRWGGHAPLPLNCGGVRVGQFKMCNPHFQTDIHHAEAAFSKRRQSATTTADRRHHILFPSLPPFISIYF